MPRTTTAESDHSALGFSFLAVGGKKITAADGGRLTSDGGVLLLVQAERTTGICRWLAECIADPRDPTWVIHRLDDIFVPACSRSPTVTRIPMIATPGVTIRGSAWRWAYCRDRAQGLLVVRGAVAAA